MLFLPSVIFCFLCYDPDSVQHLTPQSDLDNSELMLFQVSSEIKPVPEPEPEPVPEPERVCEDLPSSLQAEASDPEALPVGLQYSEALLSLLHDFSALFFPTYNFLGYNSDTLTSRKVTS